jgi:hypothetical protein
MCVILQNAGNGLDKLLLLNKRCFDKVGPKALRNLTLQSIVSNIKIHQTLTSHKVIIIVLQVTWRVLEKIPKTKRIWGRNMLGQNWKKRKFYGNFLQEKHCHVSIQWIHDLDQFCPAWQVLSTSYLAPIFN